MVFDNCRALFVAFLKFYTDCSPTSKGKMAAARLRDFSALAACCSSLNIIYIEPGDCIVYETPNKVFEK
jgi:hypothetical protein